MTDKIQEFDSLKCKLSNVNIVEAGAGTGKTYNIQNIYARMIIEKGFDISSILVVTFTDAATKELKDRIRTILVQIQNYFNETGNSKPQTIDNVETSGACLKGNHVPNKDYDYDYYIKNKYEERVISIAESNAVPLEIKKRRIDSALRNFDNATIFTIHGFCNRLLNDYSFESNILFNLELETNPEAIIRDIIEDFWRIENYSSNDILTTALLIRNKITIDSLKYFINTCISQAEIELEPKLNIDEDLKKFRTHFNRLKQVFNKEELIDMLSADYFNKTKYGPQKAENIASEIEYFLNGIITDKTIEVLGKLTEEQIKAGIKGNKCELFNYYGHELFITARQLVDLEHIVKLYAPMIKTKCAAYFFREYKKRKQRLNIQTFDDLLNNVSNIINQENSLLKKAAISKYNAAMIDEFQDTDAVQYNIFKKLFIESGKPVFLVGDPKQAIYAFRGGDIFTYQKAKKENKNGNVYSLSKNWRSADNMVNAVNDVFNPDNNVNFPFADKNIEFKKSMVNKQKNNLFIKDSIDKKPLKFLMAEGLYNKTSLEQVCANITAEEIYKILTNQNYKFTNKKNDKKSENSIIPNDIAILVNSHAQSRMIKKALNEYNIPSVLQATGSVFDTDEAEEIEYILKAVANSNNTNLIKGALLTNILGYTPNEILEITTGDNIKSLLQYEEILALFKEFNEICTKYSFIEMFNTLTNKLTIKEKILSQPDGERKLTNILHITELLQEKEISSKLGLNGLIAWLSKQRNKNTRDDKDEYEIKLETDNDAVKVLTVHKSKGLEFPIVFCPFLWKNYAIPYNLNKVNCKYHKDGKALLNLNSSEEAMGMFFDEQLQELIRVLYVAVTRAKYQCYIVWGQIKQSDKAQPPTSSLDYIFKFTSDSFYKGNIAKTLSSLGFEIPNLSKSDYQDVITVAHNEIQPQIFINSHKSKQDLTYKIFNIKLLESNWKITSFSGLLHHGSDTEFYQIKDNDPSDNHLEKQQKEETIDDKISIFTFTPGAKTGTCWHSIFENIDYTSSDSDIYEIVVKLLSDYSLTETDDETELIVKRKCIFEMVKNTLNTVLNQKEELSLNKITNENRLVELEFNLSLKKGFSTLELSEIIFEYSKMFNFKNKITEWNDEFIKGYMTGFIDLVFRHNGKYYIIDWKSNIIDKTPESFKEKGLKREIAKNFYFLQYLLYSVALDRFLAQTLSGYSYEQHFGEIFIGGIGLSMIARLVPKRIMGAMMGVWFMATAAAMVIGGFIAAFASVPENVKNPVTTLPIYTDLFFKLGLVTFIIAIAMFATAPILKRYIK